MTGPAGTGGIGGGDIVTFASSAWGTGPKPLLTPRSGLVRPQAFGLVDAHLNHIVAATDAVFSNPVAVGQTITPQVAGSVVNVVEFAPQEANAAALAGALHTGAAGSVGILWQAGFTPHAAANYDMLFAYSDGANIAHRRCQVRVQRCGSRHRQPRGHDCGRRHRHGRTRRCGVPGFAQYPQHPHLGLRPVTGLLVARSTAGGFGSPLLSYELGKRAHRKAQRRGMQGNVIVIDRISGMAVVNGMLRIECVALDTTGKEVPSGSVLIPGNVIGPVVQSLVNAVQEIDKKMREQAAAAAADNMPTTIPTGKFS